MVSEFVSVCMCVSNSPLLVGFILLHCALDRDESFEFMSAVFFYFPFLVPPQPCVSLSIELAHSASVIDSSHCWYETHAEF